MQRRIVPSTQEKRYHAVGKRKNAIARVWAKPGEGKLVINKRQADEYFPRSSLRMLIRQPLDLVNFDGTYDFFVSVRGGGVSGQAGAVRHALTNALMKIDGEVRSPLKKAGFITRDSRIKERKKYGRKKARKRFQFSKR